jgi:hypothetical protein
MTVEIFPGNHKGCGVRIGRTEVISGLPWQSSGVAGEPSRVRGASVTFEAGRRGPAPPGICIHSVRR